MKLPNHILVIRLSALGDVAMLIPVLKGLLDAHPILTITIISRPFYKPLFQSIPNCNFIEAHVYGKHKGFGLFKLAKEAKKMEIDAIADTHNVLRSKLLRFYFFLSRIPIVCLNKGRVEKKKATAPIANKKLIPLKTTHQRYADVFEKLGYSITLAQVAPLKKVQLSEKLYTLIGKHTKKLIGIAPFAAHKGKMYPLDKMKEVLRKLGNTNDYQLLLFGSKNEAKKLKTLCEGIDNNIVIAGQLELIEELNLISNLDGMLAMDSGNGHLAALYGVPVITLWGVTHPYLGFTPFKQPRSHQIISNRTQFPLIPTSVYGNKYPKGYKNVMTSIPVSLVVEKVRSVF